MLPQPFIQTWKVQEPLPASFRYWRDTFRAHNPEFELQLFDDGDNASFSRCIVRGSGAVYDACPGEIHRQAFRWRLLRSRMMLPPARLRELFPKRSAVTSWTGSWHDARTLRPLQVWTRLRARWAAAVFGLP